MISAPENSNKFQKIRFWKEKSVGDVLTLGPMAQASKAWHSCWHLANFIEFFFYNDFVNK